MTPQEKLDLRERQLAAREGKPGFKQNCAEIRAEIARLKEQMNG
jgi:hypothetical protein